MSKGMSGVKTLTAKQIADKWKLPLAVVAKKIQAGIKVEKEHTTSTKQANEIARDHLGERPDYYEKLDKMEKQPVVKEQTTTTTGIGGLGFKTGTPAIDPDNQYTDTNSMSYEDWNGAILKMIKDKHHRHLVDMGFTSYSPNDIQNASNSVMKESLLNELGEYDNKGGMTGYEGISGPIRAVRKNDMAEDKDPCWKGYQMVGMKKKGGRKVPNCVPVEEQGSPANPSYTERPTYENKNAYPTGADRGIYQEGYASIGHPFDRFGDVNRKAKFYGSKPKPTTTKSDEKDDTYKGSKQGGKVKLVKTVKEAMATEVPPSYQPTQTQIQRAAPQQARGVQAGQTKINVRSIAPRSTTSGTGSARLSQGGTSGGYNTLKPTTTDVKRNISNRFNPNFSQQATGSMKASGVRASTSFSQGGGQIAQKMAKSSPSQMISKMSDAGRQAASVVSKAAPTAAKVAGSIARVAAGPAATAAAAVMSPTPAGEKKSEFQRQSDVAKGVSYKAQGRSISDYEKQVLTPKASETPKAVNPKVDAPTPPSRPDYFSRGQAFGAARGEAGGGEGKFSYDNKQYQTNVKGEPYKPSSELKQTTVKEFWTPYLTPHHKHTARLSKEKANKPDTIVDPGAGGTTKTTYEESKMDTKEHINEALDNILEDNLSEMKDHLLVALQEKAMEKLEERKKEIAANYFAE